MSFVAGLGDDVVGLIGEFLDPVELVSYRLCCTSVKRSIDMHWIKILNLYSIKPIHDYAQIDSLHDKYHTCLSKYSLSLVLPTSLIVFQTDGENYNLTVKALLKLKDCKFEQVPLILSEHQTLFPELERILSHSNEEKVAQEILAPNKAIWLSYCLDQVFPGVMDHSTGELAETRMFVRGATGIVFCRCVLNNPSFQVAWSDELKSRYASFFLLPYLKSAMFVSTGNCIDISRYDHETFARSLASVLSPNLKRLEINGLRCFNSDASTWKEAIWMFAAEGKKYKIEPRLRIETIDFNYLSHRRKKLGKKDEFVFKYKVSSSIAPESSFGILDFEGLEKCGSVSEVRLIGHHIKDEDFISNFCCKAQSTDWSVLIILDLSFNQISDIGFAEMLQTDSFCSLKTLILAKNSISLSAPRAEVSQSLREVKLFTNTAVGEGNNYASWSRNLTYLDVSSCRVTNKGFRVILETFVSLNDLNCAANLITDDSLISLVPFIPTCSSSLTKLKRVNLQENQISENGLDLLALQVSSSSKRFYEQLTPKTDVLILDLRKTFYKSVSKKNEDKLSWKGLYEQFGVDLILSQEEHVKIKSKKSSSYSIDF